MPGTITMFCIRMKILSHRNNIVLFLACNMAAVQNLYSSIATPLLDKMLVHSRLPLCILSGFPGMLLAPIYTPGWREAL